MQATKEGIEQVKDANDLAGVLAERGIAVMLKPVPNSGGSRLPFRASQPFHSGLPCSWRFVPAAE